ncbi:MAG: hypothetical protein UY11_C0028G0016 [Candidatus Amesbacteria bacterium GW2011_GWC2_47_8]|uniref:Ferric oxidoreductase domain-containing protein n=1 Tax=Candidatus Amesbacteria bacterium GW2011_GWC2_47_8 TaxID=1618367 RepID=A0A0G1TMT3_9BACT|nr:MAG: hypothetical protein UY11_C0028G0016 [Candidatus Amesbacteria bacterium GW2011_GWC2_47_8]
MDVYLLARAIGVTAFSLMLVQIILATWFRKYIKWHMWIGKIAFILAWIHPALLEFGRGLGGDVWWGKIGAIFRIKHWRWIHRLNYVALVLIYVHSWNLGSDVRRFPIILLYWLAPVVLVLAIWEKLRQKEIPA